MRRYPLIAVLCGAGIALLFLYHLYAQQPTRELAFPSLDLTTGAPGFSTHLTFQTFDRSKPANVKVIGLVFFGRKSRVQILRCYLERNLVDNGGWLDEVHWVKNIGNPDDLKYLDEILAMSPRYKVVEVEVLGVAGYWQAWQQLEPGSLYIKIDDDVVWFEDETIPRVVTIKLDRPESLIVSANLVNSPLMGFVHYHMGALRPYPPKLDGEEPGPFDFAKPSHKPWNYRAYPNWTGPDDYFFGLNQTPPYDGHRWLRLPNDNDILRTPVAEIEYKTFWTGLESWAIAAQQHYSFLESLADGKLDRYQIGGLSDTTHIRRPWFTTGKRLSINFIAIWADDVLANPPYKIDDEEWLTINLPKKLQRPVIVNTEALAAHFSFKYQGSLDKTDLLARYQEYTHEEKCARLV